uniref:Cytochrome n=1 Tax=Lutzomyia longipalpis TaxID=7200 RepID=A0A1B0CBY9_LUTLO
MINAGPQWYPFVGNSVQLRRTAARLGGTHLVYKQWALEYKSPDVVGFRLGSQFFIVGLSAKAVNDIHKSSVFDGRPKDFFTQIRTLDTYGGITFTDGSLWKEHRCFTVKRLKTLGFGSNRMKELIEKEICSFKGAIDEQMAKEGSLWPGQFLKSSVMNILWTMVVGDDREHSVMSETLVKLLEERIKSFDLSGGALSDLPWLRFLVPEYSGYNLLCRINSKVQEILQKIINDHHRRFTEDKANDDFIYAFIQEMKNQEGMGNSTFTDRQLMVVMMDFVIGGSYTSRGTLDLALMTLAIYPKIQEEIYGEIARIGDTLSCTNPTELPLTQAYLMEIGRFYNLAPVAGPRRTLEDTELCGYRIPENTTVLIGSEFVHMDKVLWGDPEVFRPSRFLDASGTKIIHPEHFYQFGKGRRMCMGITLAKAFLHTFLTTIVHDYRISIAP